MVKKQLRIALKSDLCAGSGFAFAGIVDSDVTFDEYGFPYISGRRIKGCMRDAAELIGVNTAIIEALFGRKYAGEYDAGAVNGVVIPDAYPETIVSNEIMESLLADPEYEDYYTQENILKQFTSTRSNTRIDRASGTAQDNTLRFTRVVNKTRFYDQSTMIFCTKISFPKDYEKDIERIILATRNIGMNRNRGLGSVQMKLTESSEVNANLITAGTTSADRVVISYVVRNDAPLVISSDKDTVSLDYIPGYTVLGAFAKEYLNIPGNSAGDSAFQDLFLNGKTEFSDLNYAEEDAEDNVKVYRKYYVAPSYINIMKKTGKLVDVEVLSDYESNSPIPDADDYCPRNGNQPKKLKGKRIAAFTGENGKKGYRIAEVKKEIIYHHTKKSDKPGASNGNMLYFFDAVSKGQLFAGEIVVPKVYKECILNILSKGVVFFGKSKSAQYGRCSIVEVKPDNYTVRHDPKEIPPEAKDVIVNLRSDAVFINDNGEYTSDYGEVWEIIRSSLSADTKDPRKSSVGIKTICGYSGVWNLHKQEIPAVAAGSTFVFKNVNAAVLPDRLGVRTNEGFGEYEITEHSDDYKLAMGKKKAPQKYTIGSSETNPIIKEVYRRALLKGITDSARTRAFSNGSIGVSASALGRLALMAVESWNSSLGTGNVAMKAYESMIKRVNSIKGETVHDEALRYMKDTFGYFPKISPDDNTGEYNVSLNENDIVSITNAIAAGEPELLKKLQQLDGLEEANALVFEQWYNLALESMTYQKYLKKEER